jgi:hypothetical protein
VATQTESPVASKRGPLLSRVQAGWRGEASLAWAFWGFHFGGGLLLLAIGSFGFLFLMPFTYNKAQGVLASPIFRAYLLVGVVTYLAYVIASIVMVWRCSFNVGWRGWGYIARVLMFLWLMRLLPFSLWCAKRLTFACRGRAEQRFLALLAVYRRAADAKS